MEHSDVVVAGAGVVEAAIARAFASLGREREREREAAITFRLTILPDLEARRHPNNRPLTCCAGSILLARARQDASETAPIDLRICGNQSTTGATLIFSIARPPGRNCK